MKKWIAAVLTLILLVSCAIPAFAADETLSVYSSYIIPTGSVRMTAHRGYSALAPENTLPSFRLAGEYGFWGAECDTSPTKDGVWIIMHDDTVDRMTDGEGKIIDLTYEEIRALKIDTGSNVASYPDTGVPTLTEYLDVCKEYGMHAVIEIKECAPAESMESLAALLSAREEKDMFTLITFGREQAVRIKQLLPETPVYFLIGGTADEKFPEAVQFCLENGLDGLDFAGIWGKKDVRSAQKAGLRTMVWTIDDIESAEKYYRWGLRDFTTNALTPMQPQGNRAQQFLWRLRDGFYLLSVRLRSLFGAGADTKGAPAGNRFC